MVIFAYEPFTLRPHSQYTHSWMLNFSLISPLIFSNVYGFPATKTSSHHDFQLTIINFIIENSGVGLASFQFAFLIKYLDISINHKRTASKFPYTNFPSKIQYSSRNAFAVITRSTMPSGHSMNISTGISGCRNAASTSHISDTYPSSLWYKFSPIRILVYVYVSTGENGSVQSTPGNCMYNLTTFINFKQINPSGSSLLSNTQLTGDELFQPHMGQFTQWTSTVPVKETQFRVHVVGSKTLF